MSEWRNLDMDRDSNSGPSVFRLDALASKLIRSLRLRRVSKRLGHRLGLTEMVEPLPDKRKVPGSSRGPCRDFSILTF